jgi:hypothetical protein
MIVEDPAISLLLATANFEWTFRRIVIALGITPNVDLRIKFKNYVGLEKFKILWKEEVSFKQKQPAITTVIKNWNELKKGFELRNKLIHGVESTTKYFAEPKILSILEATNYLREFSISNNYNPEDKLPIRFRKVNQ